MTLADKCYRQKTNFLLNYESIDSTVLLHFIKPMLLIFDKIILKQWKIRNRIT